jgi:hypothetical protein
MNFLNWYKKTVESGTDEPPTWVWEDIQNDLDIDTVYERLEKSLNKDRRKVWIWRASSAAGILLILSFGYLLVYREDRTSSKQPVAQNSSNNIPIDTISEQGNTLVLQRDSATKETIIERDRRNTHIDSANTSNPKETTIERNRLVLKTDTVENNLLVRSTAEPLENEIRTASTPGVINVKKDNKEHPGRDFFIDFPDKQLASIKGSLPETQLMLVVPESPPAHLDIPEINQDISKPINKNPNRILSKVTISAHGEIANTWLISPKTIEAFDPQKLTSTRPTFKQNYGFSIAGTLTERWEVIGQLSLSRQNGQHYQEYYQGKYVSNKIDLEYTDIAFKARYRPFRTDLKHTISTGLYMGFLDNARQYIGDETTTITSDYTNTDYGFIAGYQYIAPISDKITLAAGAFYRQGLKNIFAGNNLISSNLNNSTNTSFNFSISVGYTFSL